MRIIVGLHLIRCILMFGTPLVRYNSLVTILAAIVITAVGCGSTADEPATVSMASCEAANTVETGPCEFDSLEQSIPVDGALARPLTWLEWKPVGEIRGLVYFSHGQDSKANFHSSLAEHWASHGYLVIAPDHYGAAAASEKFDATHVSREHDLVDLIEMYAADTSLPATVTDNLIVVAHSYGSIGSLHACGATYDEVSITQSCDDNVKSSCVLEKAIATPASAQGFPSIVPTPTLCIMLTPLIENVYGTFTPEHTFSGSNSIDVPTLLVAASDDEILPADQVLQFAESAPRDTVAAVTLRGAGHFSFTDITHEGTAQHEDVLRATRAIVLTAAHQVTQTTLEATKESVLQLNSTLGTAQLE